MSTRKSKPYIFYGQTTSLCEECLHLVPAKILIEGDDVYYQKRCSVHGTQKTKISSDAEFFKLGKTYLKPGDRPLKVQSKTEYGCPYDCGLCADHEQHSCLALLEVNEVCNLSCPVCFADSSPDKTTNRSLEEIEQMLEVLIESEGEPDLLQISGGEPTLHPQIIDIIKLARSKPIRHVMLNTNGIRIANDKAFVSELATMKTGFEVYLQFDSLERNALKELRGVDLCSVRERALQNLEKYNISTTLVVVVKRGVNDGEIGRIIEHALQYNCIRGITFQPIQDAGRNLDYDKNEDRFLLSDIRKKILETSSIFGEQDIIPLPCNPESIAIAYGIRNGSEVIPVTSLIPREQLIEVAPNAVTFEKNTELKEKLYELLSLSTACANTSEKLYSFLCCLPKVVAPENLGYENIFRITIIQFMDKYNFCVGGVKRSCIHFLTPDGQIIPFDTYNLFYRNGLIRKIRGNKEANREIQVNV